MRTNPAFPQPRAARLSPLAGALALILAPAAHSAVIFVTDGGDVPVAPAGLTLREAINAANSNCFSDPFPTIQFTGAFVISPSSPLPAFSCSSNFFNPLVDGLYGGSVVTLNGTSSSASCGLDILPGFYGGQLGVHHMKIQNFGDGTFAAGACGNLLLKSNTFLNNSIGAMLRGNSQVGDSESPNVFVRNSNAGIYAYGGAGSFISHNLIGTADGTTADANGDGIFVGGGGGITIEFNTISGNTGYGVRINNGAATFEGNFIGTKSGGDGALANGAGGVWLVNNFGTSFENDTISGNGGPGATIDNSDFVVFAGSWIGVNSSGAPIPNTRGIEAFCSGYIGVYDSSVSSNSNDGLHLDHVYLSEVNTNTINGNGRDGVRVNTNPAVDCSSASNNAFDNNTITDNTLNGIVILGPSTANEIDQNSIFGNGLKNINLGGGTLPLPNDPTDADGGPNNQQNWPIIDSVLQEDGQTIIAFHIQSSTASNIDIAAYANSALGKPAGEEWIGSTSLCGDCSEYSGTLVIPGLYNNISLTATVNNDTSEFSEMKAGLTAPAVTLSRDHIDFGDIQVGGSSPARSVVLRSIGDQPWTIDTIDESGSFCYGPALLTRAAADITNICYGGAFICSSTCDTKTPYAKNQTCAITATFSPSFAGFFSTTIYVCDNTSTSPETILLTGNGIPPPPIHITPSEFDFGNVLLGTHSEAASFTVSNDYGGSIPISIQTTGDFEIVASTCGPFIPGEGSCQVAVEFVPTESGRVEGDLLVYIVSEPAKAALAVTPAARAALSGTGVSGATLVLPDSLNVGVSIVGGSNATRTVELRNDSTEPINFSSVTVSANFILVNNCPAVLLPGQACTLVISFAAPSVGNFTGTLTVVTDATGGSAEIPLTAIGQLSASALLRVVPSSIGFGDRVIGSQSASQQVTITNVGGAPATLNLTTSSIDFVIAGNTCAATLESQASCFAQVAFRPLLGFGQRSGQLIVTSNSSGSPHTVNLGGTGCRPFIASGNRSGSSSNCAP